MIEVKRLCVQVPNFAFGCGHDNEGSFAGADGILGLGQGPLSFPSQLKNVFNGKFSYCLVDWLAPPTQTSALLFGDAAMPTLPDVKYLPLLTNPKIVTYYYVQLNGISVGDKLLKSRPPSSPSTASVAPAPSSTPAPR